MPEASINVLTMGNALVDLFSEIEDHQLLEYDLKKGIMHLIDEERAAWLPAQLTISERASGGSAANTAAGVASLGGESAFIGKVKADELGTFYAEHMREAGVVFETELASEGEATGACVVLISPDGERTFNTYLGAGQGLCEQDITAQAELIQSARVTYFEGYLWDPPEPKKAFVLAAKLAHEADQEVALTLSDPFCVDRYRDEFRELISKRQVDIVFANQDELLALYQTDDFDQAARQICAEAKLAAITRGAEGCTIIDGPNRLDLPAEAVEEVADLTGAGDQFAAGFLYGYSKRFPHEISGRLGCLAAAEVISHVGARPLKSLKRLALAEGLLR